MDGKGSRAARAAGVVALVGAAAGWQTFAAFSSTTSNSGNSFSAGTVFVSDNDNGCAMYQAPAPGGAPCNTVTLDADNKGPGDTVTGCYQVTYTGTLPADMKMYWSPAASGDTLSPYLNLKVERGTTTTGFNDCSGFTPDNPGTYLYDSTLSTFNTSVSPRDAGYPNGGTEWAENDAVAYRITVTLADDNNANGAGSGSKTTGSHAFTWLATSQ